MARPFSRPARSPKTKSLPSPLRLAALWLLLSLALGFAPEAGAQTIDYGDAPASYGSPGHTFTASGPRIGANATDAELAPHYSADASGDDLNGTDDEDGIDFGDPQVGQSVRFVVYVPQGILSGYLSAWVDWNRDGDFLDAGEQIAANRADDGTLSDYGSNDRYIQILVNVPATALAGQSYFARFRLSTQRDLAAQSGLAPDGEIEDHLFTVNAYTPPVGAPTGACAGPNLLGNGDFADHTNWTIGYASPTTSGGYAVGEAGVNSSLTTSPVYRNNASGVFRSFVDNAGNLGGVSGLHLRNETTVSVIQGQTYLFSYDYRRIVNTAYENAAINWVLINPSTNAIVQTIPNVSLNLSGSPASWTQYASPFVATAPTGSYKVAMTFRPHEDGTRQVVDYYLDRVYFAPLYACDFGDAPASYGEPMHLIAGGLKLGSVAPDSENAHQPSATAAGDDLNGIDDEDGVSAFPPLFAAETSYRLPAANLSATGTGTLHAWIDFDKNGAFTANEHASVAVTNGVLAGPLNWTGISIGAAGGSYARLRFTSTALEDLPTTSALDERAVAPAFDGEVEDYAVTFQTAAALPPNAGMAVCATPGGVGGPGSWPVGWFHHSPANTLDADGRWPDLPSGSPTYGALGAEISAAAALAPGAGLSYAPFGASDYLASGADGFSAAAAYMLQDHVAYSFTASPALGAGAYLRRFSLSLPAAQTTRAPFRVTLLISTDPNFSTATVLASNYLATASGRLVVAAEAPVLLTPGASYHLRALIHNAAGSSGTVFWDDFALDVGGCADLSDAPLSYGAAHHSGGSAMRLGAARDTETLSIASLDATGDGADDDGVFYGSASGGLGLQNGTFTQGVPQILEFSVAGTGGRLSGWFDWNRDGAFSNPEERAIVDVTDNGPGDLNPALGVIGVSVTPPPLTSGVSFARFRWSSGAGLSATGAAPDGEVEDYRILLVGRDKLEFVLSPDNESFGEAGQLAIYAHHLLIGEALGGGTVDFQIVSDGGLVWRLLRDDGDGVHGAGDAPWPAGGAALPAGSHGFWLVARIPQETPAEWRDLTLLRATILSGGLSKSSEVQDLTRIGGGEPGRLFARKLQALDADCDGAPDGGEAAFTTQERSIALGGCAIYRIVFENIGAERITNVRVHDHTPDWTVYRSGSAQTLSPLSSLTPQTPITPAADQKGEVLFPFFGSLQPGERGVVQFSVRLLGGSGTPAQGGPAN